MTVESPQSFVTGHACDKLTFENGYRHELGEVGGWRRYGSSTAQGSIWLARVMGGGDWLLALDHAGVIGEMDIPCAAIEGPGLARYAFVDLDDLYALMPRIYRLSVSLPNTPLAHFTARVRNLPRKTEAERLVIQRIGQDIFREGLMEYWQGRCPLTGITDAALLRASHIIPWADCESDDERLDVHNGLLLSALWDAAFDRGLVTFRDDGCPEFSPALSDAAHNQLRWATPLCLTDRHRARLIHHRAMIFVGEAG